MVDKDISQDRKFRVDGRDFTEFRLEGGTEASEGGWRIQLGDFALDLAGNEFALEICISQR